VDKSRLRGIASNSGQLRAINYILLHLASSRFPTQACSFSDLDCAGLRVFCVCSERSGLTRGSASSRDHTIGHLGVRRFCPLGDDEDGRSVQSSQSMSRYKHAQNTANSTVFEAYRYGDVLSAGILAVVCLTIEARCGVAFSSYPDLAFRRAWSCPPPLLDTRSAPAPCAGPGHDSSSLEPAPLPGNGADPLQDPSDMAGNAAWPGAAATMESGVGKCYAEVWSEGTSFGIVRGLAACDVFRVSS